MTLSALVIVWVIVGRPIQQALKPRACPEGVLCSDGRHYVALAVLVGLTASALGLLIRRGERSLLLWLTLVPAVLFAVARCSGRGQTHHPIG